MCTFRFYTNHYALVTIYLSGYVLIFRGTPGAVTEPYMSYLYAINVTTTDEACKDPTNMACTEHYRNPLIDMWESIGVTKVIHCEKS